jgi:hypothetical protein
LYLLLSWPAAKYFQKRKEKNGKKRKEKAMILGGCWKKQKETE